MALNKIKEWQLDLSGINAKIEAIGKPVNFKGRVDSVDQLPEVGADGDLYYVGPIGSENKKEYIWYDGAFELVGSTSREDYDSLHNDLDELGDQVAEIESKIPESTSDTNPLINKQQLLDEEMDIREDMMESDSELQTQINALADAIQGGGGGGASALYTKDNLLGGKNIEIKEEISGEEIDDNTVLLLHLDGDFTDSSENGSSTTYNTTDQDKFEFLTEYNGTQKFGNFLHNNRGSSSIMFEGAQTISKVNGSFTIDFWFLTGTTTSDIVSCVLYGNDAYQFVISPNDSRISINLGAETNYQSINKTVSITSNIWHHAAIVYSAEDSSITCYIDGEEKCVFSGYSLSFGSGATNFSISLNGNVCKDEVRLSNVARYKGTFAPLTKPYGDVEKTGKSFIDCTLEIPDVGYTPDNLVAGENIAFNQVVTGGGIDQYTLACWHFDTDRKDVINDLSYTSTSGSNPQGLEYAKFGEGGIYSKYQAHNNFSLAQTDEWTIDTWWKPLSSGTYFAAGVGPIVSSYETPQYVHVKFDTGANKVYIAPNYTIVSANNAAASVDFTFTLNQYYHLAVQRDNNGTVSAYIDGIKVLEHAGNYTNTSSSLGYGSNNGYMDELRVSKIARYSGNFTPPTEPYRTPEVLDKWKVDNTLTRLSQLENDSGFIASSGGTFTGQPIVKSASSGGNCLALTVAQDWTSGDLYSSFVEGRAGSNQNKRLGRIGFRQTNTHTANFWIQAFDPSTNTNKGQVLVAGYDGANNINFLRGINPPAASNSIDLATTAWAKWLMDPYKDITLLYSGETNGADLVLSEPFTNFYQLLLTFSDGNREHLGKVVIPTTPLNSCLADASLGGAVLMSGAWYWNIRTYSNGSTTTLFKYLNTNCKMWAIQGVYRK